MSDKGKVARQQQVGRQTQFVGAKFAYIGKVFLQYLITFQLQCSSVFIGWNISAESFLFLPEIFFVKDCLEEIARFVATVK